MQKISEQKSEYVFAEPLFRLLSYLVRCEQLFVWLFYHSTQIWCTFLVSSKHLLSVPSIFSVIPHTSEESIVDASLRSA